MLKTRLLRLARGMVPVAMLSMTACQDVMQVPDHTATGMAEVENDFGISVGIPWKAVKKGDVLQVVIGYSDAPLNIITMSGDSVKIYSNPPGRRRPSYYEMSAAEWDAAVTQRKPGFEWVADIREQLKIAYVFQADKKQIEGGKLSWRKPEAKSYVCGSFQYTFKQNEVLIPGRVESKIGWCCGADTTVDEIFAADIIVENVDWQAGEIREVDNMRVKNMAELLESRWWSMTQERFEDLWDFKAPECDDEVALAQ